MYIPIFLDFDTESPQIGYHMFNNYKVYYKL